MKPLYVAATGQHVYQMVLMKEGSFVPMGGYWRPDVEVENKRIQAEAEAELEKKREEGDSKSLSRKFKDIIVTPPAF